MTRSAVKTAWKHRKDARDFLKAAKEAKDGVNVSADSLELDGHVDEDFDGHAQAAGGIRTAFSKVTVYDAAAAFAVVSDVIHLGGENHSAVIYLMLYT